MPRRPVDADNLSNLFDDPDQDEDSDERWEEEDYADNPWEDEALPYWDEEESLFDEELEQMDDEDEED